MADEPGAGRPSDRAVALTNIDDIIILAVFFGQATSRAGRLRVVLGQYIGFAGILLAAVLGPSAQDFSPRRAIPYLGLVPPLLGLRAAWKVWRECRETAVGTEAGSEGAALADAATDPRMTLQRFHRPEVCVMAIPGALPLGHDPGPTDLVLISAQPELTSKASRAIDARIHECQAESWLSRKPVTILAAHQGARLACAA